MGKIDLDQWAPTDFKHGTLPYILFILLVLVMFIIGFHAMMGPVLTTAVVLTIFLGAACIVGVVEKHARKDAEEE